MAKNIRRFRNRIVMTEQGPMDNLEEHPDGEWVIYDEYNDSLLRDCECPGPDHDWYCPNRPIYDIDL